MKLPEAINLLNKFLIKSPYPNGGLGFECIVLTDGKMPPNHRVHYKSPLLTLYMDNQGNVDYSNVHLKDILKDTWEICIYRNISMASGTDKPHEYYSRTNHIQVYLDELNDEGVV